jgi:AraC-like DNA-binding protein
MILSHSLFRWYRDCRARSVDNATVGSHIGPSIDGAVGLEFDRSPPGYSAIATSAVAVLRTFTERVALDLALGGARIAHGGARIAHAWTAREAQAALRQTGATALLISPCLRDGTESAPFVRQVRAVAPQILIAAPDAAMDGDSPRTHDAGLRPFLASSRQNVLTMKALVANAQPRWRLRALAKEVSAQIDASPADLAIIEYFVENGDAGTSVARAAAELGVSEDTLEKRVNRATHLCPRQLRTWGRLMAAGVLIDASLMRTGRIAIEVFGFSSAAGLCNLMKEYVGRAPAGLRGYGGCGYVVDHFVRTIRGRRGITAGTERNVS